MSAPAVAETVEMTLLRGADVYAPDALGTMDVLVVG